MGRAVLEALPAIALLYVTFWLGMRTERRKRHAVADPTPVIATLRELLVADPVGQPSDYTVRKLQAHEALAVYDRRLLTD